MHFDATSISQELARYLINKANKRYRYQSAKKQAFHQLTKQQAKEFSQQYSKIFMNLQNITPNDQKPILGKEDLLLPPSCQKKRHNFQHTSALNSPNRKVSHSINKNTGKRTSRLTEKPQKPKQTLCLPLKLKEQTDERIELLRLKKEKVCNLQGFFKETQKLQKAKQKVEKMSNNPFTTDYNGEKIEFKRLSKLQNTEFYYFIDVNTKIREERQQNQKTFRLQSSLNHFKADNYSKQNVRRHLMPQNRTIIYRKQTKNTLSEVSNQRFSKESIKFDKMALKQVQKDSGMHQKAQKSNFRRLKANHTHTSSIGFFKSF